MKMTKENAEKSLDIFAERYLIIKDEYDKTYEELERLRALLINLRSDIQQAEKDSKGILGKIKLSFKHGAENTPYMNPREAEMYRLGYNIGYRAGYSAGENDYGYRVGF